MGRHQALAQGNSMCRAEAPKGSMSQKGSAISAPLDICILLSSSLLSLLSSLQAGEHSQKLGFW